MEGLIGLSLGIISAIIFTFIGAIAGYVSLANKILKELNKLSPHQKRLLIDLILCSKTIQ